VGRLTVKLITFWQNQMAYKHTRWLSFRVLTIILITFRWLQKLGRDCWEVNEEH